MALIKKQQIRGMSVEQMDEKLAELRTEMGKMRNQVRSGGAPENPGRMRELRRTIARLETFKSRGPEKEPSEEKMA